MVVRRRGDVYTTAAATVGFFRGVISCFFEYNSYGKNNLYRCELPFVRNRNFTYIFIIYIITIITFLLLFQFLSRTRNVLFYHDIGNFCMSVYTISTKRSKYSDHHSHGKFLVAVGVQLILSEDHFLNFLIVFR